VTTTAGAIVVLYGLIVAWWVLLHVLQFFYKPRRYFLGPRAPRLTSKKGPFLSIILAAKDEAENIGPCVRSVLDSEYKHFELIVIDDRSTDSTAREVEVASCGDPRLQLLRIRELPAGWTGKMNAVRQGLARARGDVVLIMDADTRHTPATLGTALAALDRKRSAMLSLLPRIEHRNFLSTIVQPMVGALVCVWKPLPWINSRKRKTMYFGWGGFLMVRREALDAVGGFEAVKDRFAADISLAGLLKKAGHRIRVLHGPELVSTYMYSTAGEIIRGWTRLLRITADNRPGKLALTLAGLAILCLSAYPMLGIGLASLACAGSLGATLGLMGLAHLGLQVWFLGRINRIGGSNPLFALGHLPAVLTTCYLAGLALVRCRSTQMNWRGTRYRLHSDGRAI
jgi:cellulose synthase/poly-beta-1,6-N-acetylglucosamine synthase-like glycosyltransferase